MPTTDNRSWTLTKLQTFVTQIKSWVSGKVKNNLTTTTTGDMLDASQGKVLDEKITDTAKLSGIVEDGTTATHAIAKGQFVVWQRALYTADAAISVGETLAATGGSKNLTAVSDGGLNALNASLAWKVAGTQTGTTHIQLPAEFNELLVHVKGESNYVNFTIPIPKNILSTSDFYFGNGAYLSSSSYNSVTIAASTTEVFLYYVTESGTVKTNISTITVMYR